jgi:hypothetical protein
VVERYLRDFQIRRQQVWFNFPPAYARHLRFKPNAGEVGKPAENPKMVASK